MNDYILIAEDDADINHMLFELLSLNGYRCVQAFSGTEAWMHMEKKPPAAVILDLMLPGLSGEELLKRMKERAADMAVIVASAKEQVDTRITLLKQGADDYITKPFDTGELLARLEAVLRRSKNGRWNYVHAKPALHYKDISMYPEEFTAFLKDAQIPLTKREFQILELLMKNPGKVFTKNNIYESVWNEEYLGEDNAVNVHISNIRQKLLKLNPNETYIQTVWGIGFKMQNFNLS